MFHLKEMHDTWNSEQQWVGILDGWEWLRSSDPSENFDIFEWMQYRDRNDEEPTM